MKYLFVLFLFTTTQISSFAQGANDFDGVLKLANDDENITITQALRQKPFRDKTTMDNHNMYLLGNGKD